ncbi:hypothetical protein [Streptomyces sp. NPDC051211]
MRAVRLMAAYAFGQLDAEQAILELEAETPRHEEHSPVGPR